jgi:hypothetical protein
LTGLRIDPTLYPTFDPAFDPKPDPTFDPKQDPTLDPTSTLKSKTRKIMMQHRPSENTLFGQFSFLLV